MIFYQEKCNGYLHENIFILYIFLILDKEQFLHFYNQYNNINKNVRIFPHTPHAPTHGFFFLQSPSSFVFPLLQNRKTTEIFHFAQAYVKITSLDSMTKRP